MSEKQSFAYKMYKGVRAARGESPADYLRSIRRNVSLGVLEYTLERNQHLYRLVGYIDSSSFSGGFRRPVEISAAGGETR